MYCFHLLWFNFYRRVLTIPYYTSGVHNRVSHYCATTPGEIFVEICKHWEESLALTHALLAKQKEFMQMIYQMPISFEVSLSTEIWEIADRKPFWKPLVSQLFASIRWSFKRCRPFCLQLLWVSTSAEFIFCLYGSTWAQKKSEDSNTKWRTTSTPRCHSLVYMQKRSLLTHKFQFGLQFSIEVWCRIAGVKGPTRRSFKYWPSWSICDFLNPPATIKNLLAKNATWPSLAPKISACPPTCNL